MSPHVRQLPNRFWEVVATREENERPLKLEMAKGNQTRVQRNEA
jgi:hypothetical protein